MDPNGAVIGVVENANTAVLVTVLDGRVLDRRDIALTTGLPTHPHHHEGSAAVGRYLRPGTPAWTVPEVVALVEQVRRAADVGAANALAAVAAAVKAPIVGIALRTFADLPATVEGRIQCNKAQTFADSAMYRQALADAAAARGWWVSWYERDLARDEQAYRSLGIALGPPWRAAHRLATAAALAAVPPPPTP